MLIIGLLAISACSPAEDSVDSASSTAPPDKAPKKEAPRLDPSTAEEPDGKITAIFNGIERTWHVTSTERGGQYVSQSEWMPLFASQIEVTLMGHVSPNWPFQRAEALVINFTLHGMGENPSVLGPSITYLSGGVADNHSSSHGGTAQVAVNSAATDGDTLSISGSFSGTLPFKSLSGATDVDFQEAVVLENGTFECVIQLTGAH